MTLVDYAIALSPFVFVSAQVVMTRRYRWKGLAIGTCAALIMISGAVSIVEAWMPWKPSPEDEFGFGHGFRLYLYFMLGNFCIVGIAAILLAFTIKTE